MKADVDEYSWMERISVCLSEPLFSKWSKMCFFVCRWKNCHYSERQVKKDRGREKKKKEKEADWLSLWIFIRPQWVTHSEPAGRYRRGVFVPPVPVWSSSVQACSKTGPHCYYCFQRRGFFLFFFIKTQMTDFSGCCILIMATTSQVKTTTTKIEVLQIGEVMGNKIIKKTMTTLFTRCY